MCMWIRRVRVCVCVQECSASHAFIWLEPYKSVESTTLKPGSVCLLLEENAGVCNVVPACNTGGVEVGQKVEH